VHPHLGFRNLLRGDGGVCVSAADNFDRFDLRLVVGGLRFGFTTTGDEYLRLFS